MIIPEIILKGAIVQTPPPLTQRTSRQQASNLRAQWILGEYCRPISAEKDCSAAGKTNEVLRISPKVFRAVNLDPQQEMEL